MSVQLCSYHTDAPARWTCSSCKLDFCGHCMGFGDNPVNRSSQRCLCCDAPLTPLKLGNVIPPFTDQLPLIFRVPLQPSSLIVIGLVTLLMGLTPLALPFSLLFALAAGLIFFFQATRLTHRVAQGRLADPSVPVPNEPGWSNLGKQFAASLLLPMLAIGVGMGSGSEFLTLLLYAAAIGLMPAVLMIVIVTDRLSMALNPAHLLELVRSIGWHYITLCVILLVISSGATQLFAGMSVWLPVPLALALNAALWTYVGLVMSGLLGYVAYQQHDHLGQPVQELDLHRKTPAARKVEPPPDKAQLLMLCGRVRDAEQELFRLLRVHPHRLDLHERYQALLLMSSKLDLARAHLDVYLGRLLELGQDSQAFDAYRRFVEAGGVLDTRYPEETYRLAVQARAQRKEALALQLLSRFAQRFPDHARIPDAWYLTARILAEAQGQDHKALMVLDTLIKRYPQHELLRPAQRLQQTLINIAQRGSGTLPASPAAPPSPPPPGQDSASR